MANDDVDIGIRVREEGAALAKKVADEIRNLRGRLAEFRSELREFNTNANFALPAMGKLGSSAFRLGAGILAAAAAFAGFQGFSSFVKEGLQFNTTIETANLGIASLITAQATLKDSSGKLLTGTAALGAAQEVAADQVNKLRIAGLQTTATTQELVVAFQQAVGIGLRWGMTLDQTRKIAIQMSQAAGALGVPMNQLNEELRSLLEGNISPRNTRIASALGITNEQVKQAQAAGNLFGFVTKRLEAFSIAGEATAKTFSGVMSNVKEALQNLAGDATKPLFDALKISGQSALEGIFDLDSARISDKFAGIVEIAQRAFGGIGELLAQAIGGAVNGAAALSVWMSENKELINDIFLVVGEIVVQFKGLLGDVLGVAGGFLKAGTEAGVLNLAMRGVGVFIAGARDGLRVIVGILGAIGALILNLVLRPFAEFLEITAKVAGFFDKDLGNSLRETSTDLKGFLDEVNKGVEGIFEPFTTGQSAVQQATTRFAEMEQAADKVVSKNKEVAKSIAGITVTPTTTGTKEKISPSKAASAATIAAKSELDNQLKDLKIALDNNLLSYRVYYDKVTAAQQASIDKQIAAQQKLLAATTGTDARAKIQADINKLSADRAQAAEDNAEARRKAELKVDDEIAAAQVRLLKDQGKIAEARALEVETKFKELVARLKAEGNEAGIVIVSSLFNIDNAKAKLEEMIITAKTVTERLALELSDINQKQEAGAIREGEARDRIVDAYARAKEQLQAMLPEMERLAALTQDPASIAAVEELRLKIEQMGFTIKNTSDDLKKFKDGAREAFKSGLAEFLDKAAEGALSLGDAWKEAARSVIASLRQIATQMLANLIIQQTLKLLGGFSGGGAVGAVKKATGGYIRGPGTPTSDSIPAWLSTGEYVINARSVSHYGKGFFDELNTMGRMPVRARRRSRGFADGGLVTQTSNDPGVSGRLTVGLEDGLVLRHLESAPGQQVLIDFVERNQNKLRRMLGGQG